MQIYAKGFIYGGQKTHLMILSQGSYELYSGDNIVFKVNITKARIIS